MLKNKIFITLLLFLFIFINVKIYKYYNLKKEETKIINVIKKLNTSEINLIKTEKNIINKTKILEDYLGYIEIKNQNIKKLIVNGTDKSILDKNLVGLHKASSNIDDNYGNIILAGHNNNYAFKKLHNVNINDEIIIVSHTKCYRFKVFAIKFYDINNYSYYKNVNNDKILTLITCTINNHRLVIKAKVIT